MKNPMTDSRIDQLLHRYSDVHHKHSGMYALLAQARVWQYVRGELGLSQLELATDLKISAAYLSYLENGQRKEPDPDLLLKLAERYLKENE